MAIRASPARTARSGAASAGAGGRPQLAREEVSMSDISLNWSAAEIAMIALFMCWPGIAVGLVLGALGWPRHRLWGGALGAIAGFVLLAGYWHVYLATNLSLNLKPAPAAWMALGVCWPGPLLGALA